MLLDFCFDLPDVDENLYFHTLTNYYQGVPTIAPFSPASNEILERVINHFCHQNEAFETLFGGEFTSEG